MKKGYSVQKLFLTSILLFSFVYIKNNSLKIKEEDSIRVHFINVGQGASTLLEFPCGAVLIDAGAQDKLYKEKLLDYLNAFFSRRKDLHKTLDLVLITHDHIDHDLALKDIVDQFHIKRYIDNGLSNGSGKKQIWLQQHALDMGIIYAHYSFEDIVKNNNRRGAGNNFPVMK